MTPRIQRSSLVPSAVRLGKLIAQIQRCGVKRPGLVNKRILFAWRRTGNLAPNPLKLGDENSSLKGGALPEMMIFGHSCAPARAPQGAQLRAFVIRDGLMRTMRGTEREKDHLRVNRCLWWHLTTIYRSPRARVLHSSPPPPARRYITSGVAWHRAAVALYSRARETSR